MKMRLCSCLFVGLCACLSPARLWAAMAFTPQAVPRGGSFKIEIVPPPEGKNPSVTLYRNGTAIPSDASVSFPFAKIPENVQLGTYQVVVQVDNFTYTGEIRVRPPGTGEIRLDRIDPDHTYDTETIWIASGQPNGSPTPLRTVRLTLRGSGFLKDSPQDNSIWMNGVRQAISWDDLSKSCSPAADTEQGAVPKGIHGAVISAEEVDLCHVPVPASGALTVTAGYGDTQSDSRTFTVYSLGTAKVAFIAFGITFILASLIFLLLTLAKSCYNIAGKEYRWKLIFLDQETDTYSLSKFQFYLWTLAAIFTYAYLYVSRVFVQHGSWPDIPGTLPGIVGIGAGTAIASQVVTMANGSKGAGPEQPGFADFITSGGLVAADRVQMFLWTLFGVGAFCVGVLQKPPGTITGIEPVPDGMMYMMGLSAAGYLGGKLARKPGPVIVELNVTPGQSDAALAKAGTGAVDLPELGQPSVVATANLNTLPKVANANAQKAMDAFSGAIRAAGAVHTSSDLSNFIASLAGFRRDCEAAAAAAAADFSAAEPKASGQDASAAQRAAAFLQDFTSDATQAIAAATAPALMSAASAGSVTRTIELRGSNLSPDGTFEIGHADLPFRMLINQDGRQAPDVVARQDGSDLASVLRFTIDPARLEETDLSQYRAWFGDDAKWVATLTNPDGQKADISFSLPPQTVAPQKGS